MNNTLKLLVSSMLAVGLVACITGVGGNANNQKPLQKASQNEINNLATVQSDAKGGVVISNIPTVGNQDVVIKLIPVDASNEGRYLKDSLPSVAESGTYSSSDIVLMPHRQYKIQFEGLNQGESLKLSFKKDGALGDVASDSVPDIFSGVMIRAGVFRNYYVTNGKFYYAANGQNNISNIPVLNNNLITPFYAGNINIVNEIGDIVAQVKVGEYTNPVFENDVYPIPRYFHPLLGTQDNSAEEYKFSVSDGDKSGQSIFSFAGFTKLYPSVDFKSKFNPKIKHMFPENVLQAEGRYWPNNLFLTFDHGYTTLPGIHWVDYYTSSSTFTTTLPVPIDFVVGVPMFDTNDLKFPRYCVTNVFYADDGFELEPYPFKLKNQNVNGPSSPISKDTWSAANCFHVYDNNTNGDIGINKEEDIGMISDYNRDGYHNKSMRFAW